MGIDFAFWGSILVPMVLALLLAQYPISIVEQPRDIAPTNSSLYSATP